MNDENNRKAVLLLIDYAEKHPEIKYVTRPVFHSEGADQQQVKFLMAAGLQGKYWDLLRFFTTYDSVDAQFLKDNAAVIDLDFTRLQNDAGSAEVRDLVRDNFHAVQKSGVTTTQSLMVGRNIYYLDGPLTLPDLEKMIGNENR